ncbi:serine protease [Mesorhizobium sp. M2E.F.Ca.ET.209.01.1.1]|uniref:trypsin-like peptidase domain-containing protein n=1 Tax=Mesorhizobium sp. M2E.F.Ca.ET.209.01.1.1 TaxID=2500526 RepID=UPI000FD7D731|nr:serine protease [Mesorhizobium sp. M2E.F.Ca.ET.209.01.1.1]TGS15995.1 serine protease [Mesorhizobium sp. M2E.F.Ca.ET.209.01.1.1]
MSQYSFVTAPVEALTDRDVPVCQGTSFFYKRDARWLYLVTNWHVVTGRSPFAPKFSQTGAVPVKLRLRLHRNIGPDSFRLSQKIEHTISINDSEGEKPLWLEHPSHQYKVDIAVIRIPNDDNLTNLATFSFLDEEKDLQTDYQPEPMADAFVLGYPWGLSSGDGVLPLYKRGSVASDPRVDYSQLPRFLIDCRTAGGMSGAPVLVSRSGVWAPNGILDDSTVFGTVTNFVGVYSGRLETNMANSAAQDAISELGIVWKKAALDQIVDGGARGTKLSEL